jgi:hypothetical protein
MDQEEDMLMLGTQIVLGWLAVPEIAPEVAIVVLEQNMRAYFWPKVEIHEQLS